MVEAHLDARLFGVKVLRVDGTVLLAPGHLVEPTSVVQHDQPRTKALTATAGMAPGGELARAAQLLAENRARLDGPVPPRLARGS